MTVYLRVSNPVPWGYIWRSSQTFIVSIAILGLFAENFLYSFIVPVLPYMVENRLRLPPSQTQWYTTASLSIQGVAAIISAPFIGHFADKTPNRRTPLLVSLAATVLGTFMTALCPSTWIFFAGRVIQAIASTAGGIACSATVTDNVSQDNSGKILGSAMSFVTARIVTGPAVSGALLQLFGYWTAWSAPLALLGICFVGRLLMLERDCKQVTTGVQVASDEEDTLLDANIEPDQTELEQQGSGPPSRGFYRVMLYNAQALSALTAQMMFAVILSGFDATLPLHLQKIFHWEIGPIGLIFLGLQIPVMVLSPAVGWLRDRVGMRYPTTIGWIIVAPILVLLGVPGTGIGWAERGINGQVIFIAGIVGFGIFSSLVRGSGMMQLIATVKALEKENPFVFGPHGGTSRIFSLTESAFSIGLILGPLLTGAIVELSGFWTMTFALATFSLALAALSFVLIPPSKPNNG